MVKEQALFKEQEKRSLDENLALLNRAKNIKKRALKLMQQEGENKK